MTVTFVAGAYVTSPPCDATIVQFPTVNKVTKISLTVQTEVVLELYETGRPDDALPVSEVADPRVNAVGFILTFACEKVIV